MGKVVIAGISLILVVGVVIGVIATVSRDTTEEPRARNGVISSGMKSAQTICAPTDYKETCMEALGPIAKKDGNASPMELVGAAFDAAMVELQKAFNKSSSLQKAAKDGYDKLSMEGCQQMMDCARVELEAAIKKLKSGQIETIDELLDDLNSLLSAVLSDAKTCIEGLKNPQLKKTMESLLEKTEELTVNGLAIVEEVGTILSQFNITLPSFGGSTNSRRLLGFQMDSEGLPTWFTAADRKLLATNPTPNVVVAQDGTGKYKTIQEAVNAYPANHKGKYVIYVKEGVYDEYVQIPKRASNIYMYGDGHQNTVIRGNKNFKLKGIPTMQTATFAAMGNGFMAKGLGFENIAGPEGHQAVALRVQSDLSIFYNCRMDGYQDTFYYQSLRSFYFDCIISGTIDFIFGKGTAVIQNSKIISRMPEPTQFNTVTADGRISRRTRTGLVIQNCELIADPMLEPNKAKIPSYLGRPWSAYSTTVVMESYIGDFLRPDGWMKWNETNKFENTCEYREYGNKGPGANIAKRVNWPGFRVLDKTKAEKYTITRFSRGALRALKPSGVPFTYGLAA